MKACLTLLSHLGRLHEPPVPKPRGTPKLSERYAGPGGLSGPGGGMGGSWDLWGGTGPTLYPPSMGRVHLWVGKECCTHIPSPEAPRGPLTCGQRCQVESPTSAVPSPPLASAAFVTGRPGPAR